MMDDDGREETCGRKDEQCKILMISILKYDNEDDDAIYARLNPLLL
jgi:hypothetical protein